jgi:hypothetical protein
MDIHEIVSEVINGVKHDFVMIDLEEYNNYMLHIAYSNKTLVDVNLMMKLSIRNENKNRKKVELNVLMILKNEKDENRDERRNIKHPSIRKSEPINFIKIRSKNLKKI